MNEEVERFIRGFKEKHENEVTDIFMHGYCYWFAFILSVRFNGTIFFCPDTVHFATHIKGQIYDITGIVDTTGLHWYVWHDYLRMMYASGQEEDALAIIDMCINKDNVANKKNII